MRVPLRAAPGLLVVGVMLAGCGEPQRASTPEPKEGQAKVCVEVVGMT